MIVTASDLPLGFLINTIGRLLNERAKELFHKHSLDPVLLGVLWTVNLLPGRTQRQYASFQSRDLTTYGRLVDKLEALSLLKRVAVPGDRRAWALQTTTKGDDVLAELHATTRALEAEFTKSMTRREEAAMRDGLGKMLIALGGMGLREESELE